MLSFLLIYRSAARDCRRWPRAGRDGGGTDTHDVATSKIASLSFMSQDMSFMCPLSLVFPLRGGVETSQGRGLHAGEPAADAAQARHHGPPRPRSAQPRVPDHPDALRQLQHVQRRL